MMELFSDIGLSNATVQSIKKMGFEELTDIQEQAIPAIMSGRDLIGQSQTGTGKTAAFGIPIIEKCELATKSIQSIVITPTRELAVQVAEELNRIGQEKGVWALPIYGGQDITRQLKALRRYPQVIVGTPGRLLDHIRRGSISLTSIKIAVLDEADEMLDMGFRDDIELILAEMPQNKQTMLFSATMPQPIKDLAHKYMDKPKFIGIKTKTMTVAGIEQHYIEVQDRQKFDVLCRLLDSQAPELSIVFSRTKRRVDEIAEALSKRGYPAEGIHGDLTQARRDMVMSKFRENTIEILVATDVAARGLDISGISHIYNFDIPQDPERYVHRIGRTGRIGKAGYAITLVTPREIGHFRFIEKITKQKINRKSIPSLSEAIEGQQYIAVEQLIDTIENKDIKAYIPLAKNLLEDKDSVALVAGALKIITKEPDTTPIKLTEEKRPISGNQRRKPGKGKSPGGDRKQKKPYPADRQAKSRRRQS